MPNTRAIAIFITCLLLGLEGILFFNGGFFDDEFTRQYKLGQSHWVYAGEINIENTSANDLPSMDGEQTGEPSPEPENPLTEPEDPELLILVNKENPISATYKPEDLVLVRFFAENRSEAGRYLREEAAMQFHSLVEDAARKGYTLVMTTAYRSYGFQQVLWNNYIAKEGEEAATQYSAKPGQSEHQTGLAVDVTSPSVELELTESFAATEEGLWLAENAHRFGFIVRYPKGKESVTGYLYEPWHLRYVGRAAAETIFEQGLTLEEYLEQ